MKYERKMKIITWNLGYWQFRKHHKEAWSYLRNELQPDIALLQEVHPPSLEDGEQIVFEEIFHGWGTAVYSKSIPLERVSMKEYTERVAAARVAMPGNEVLHIASVHAPIIKGHVFPHLDSIFNDIEDKFSGSTFVIGGDLNSARLAEEVWPGNGHGPFFHRIDQGRFFDCCRKFHQEEIQTFFRKGQIHPFQDDHLFASDNLAEKVTSCEAINNKITRKVSDHIPLIVEIDLLS